MSQRPEVICPRCENDPCRCAAAGPCSASLSPTMRECADRIRSHCGVITRYPGGFWCVENSAGETVAPTYGTTTVEALVKRGVLEYSEWKQNSRGQFPIRARLTPNGPAHASAGAEISTEANDPQ